jgi:hypothetical protein
LIVPIAQPSALPKQRLDELNEAQGKNKHPHTRTLLVCWIRGRKPKRYIRRNPNS